MTNCRHHCVVTLLLAVAASDLVRGIQSQRMPHDKLCAFQSPCVPPSILSRRTSRLWYRDDTDELADAKPINVKQDENNYNPITDWTPPSSSDVDETIDTRITPLRKLTSPVFFSTSPSGERHRGLGHLPVSRENSLLIVGNHQLGGLDIWLVCPQLIEERGLFVRGLGHPVIFNDQDKHLKGGPTFLPDGQQGTFGLYQKFGAVMASPRNLYELLQTKQPVLHFPGGAREAYHGTQEAYQIFWPNQVDFVRIAAKFNATIVTLAGIGAADSVYMIADPDQLLHLPFGLSRIIQNSFLTVREAARFDYSKNKPYIRPPPLVIPKFPLPARHYFLFGRAFDTTPIHPKNRETCRELYQDIQQELKQGLNDLQRARESDPFQDSLMRFAYEYTTGKQAPTFSVDELNKHT